MDILGVKQQMIEHHDNYSLAVTVYYALIAVPVIVVVISYSLLNRESVIVTQSRMRLIFGTLIGSVGAITITIWTVHDMLLNPLSWATMGFIVAGATAALLWTSIIIYFRLEAYRIFGPDAKFPELALIRALVDAIITTNVKKSAGVERFRLHRKISISILAAASILEEPMVRLLVKNDEAADLIVRSELRAVAGGLRQNVVLFALPNPNTMKEIRNSLSTTLIGLITCDFSKLPKVEISKPSHTLATWQDRLLGMVRWFTLALIPILVVWVAIRSSWLPEGPIQSLALQFAALCFIYATFSIFGQKGQDELSGVIGAGSSLFGWSKSKE
jgi:hypothetical protein